MPRMHHCSQCDACVVKYDHHCGLAINCVGIRTYHLFLVFLLSSQLYTMATLFLNLKNNFYHGVYAGFEWYHWVHTVVLILHNAPTLFYVNQMRYWYFSMSARNMHAIEDTMVGMVFDKARFHKLLEPSMERLFYYTRESGTWANVVEMMGTSNIFRWLVPLPRDRELTGEYEYMRYELGALKKLTDLEY